MASLGGDPPALVRRDGTRAAGYIQTESRLRAHMCDSLIMRAVNARFAS
jgi:hypothetical protein